MKKHLVRWVIVLAALVGLFCLPTSASSVVDSGYCGGEGDGTNLTWTLTEDGILTISGEGRMKDYFSRLSSYYGTVTTAPWGYSSVKTISIGDAVTNIGSHAFHGCIRLTFATIGESVTSIGKWAFDGCTSLTEITLPSKLTSIGNYAFQCCGFKALAIPEGVETIGWHAFWECTDLITISIPASVSDIGYSAFRRCGKLAEIVVDDGNVVYSSKDGVLFSKDKKLLIEYPEGKQGAYTVPSSVTVIDEDAFYDAVGLTKLTIGNNIQHSYYYAFSGCENLKEVYYTGSLEEWLEIRFEADGNPAGAADRLYINGKLIDELVFPANTEVTGTNSFSGYKGLTAVTFPGSMRGTGECMFAGCTGLRSITIEEGVTIIDRCSFEGCTSLVEVSIPDSVTEVWYGAFAGCTGLKTVKFPDSVTTIGSAVFKNCSSLESVDFPDGITYIPEGMCQGCISLTKIVIPDGIETIGWYAFRDCSALREVFISESVTNIGYRAFASDKNLTTVRFWGDLPYASTESFPNGTVIYYPEGNDTWAYYSDQGTWYGCTIKPWTPWKAYNFEPLSEGALTTYGGVGTAYYRLFDKAGSALPGQNITYTIDGQRGTAVTDGNGVFSVKISGATETRDYVIEFSSTEITEDVQGAQQTLTVINADVPYSQSWNGSLGGSLKASIGPSAGVGVGVATAEAAAAKVAAKGGVNGGYELKDSYENGVRTLETEYTYDLSAGVNFKSGVSATLSKADIEVGAISAGASIAGQSSIGLKIPGYNPANQEHLLRLGLFNTQVMLTGVNSVWASKVLEWLNVEAHNQSAYSCKATLDAGASVGAVDLGNGTEYNLAGANAAGVYSFGIGTDFLEQTKSSTHSITLDYGAGIFNGLFPGTGENALGLQNCNAAELSKTHDWDDNLQGLSYKLYKEGKKNVVWYGKTEEDSTEYSFDKDQAAMLLQKNDLLRKYAAGERWFLTLGDVADVYVSVMNNDDLATVKRSHVVKKGLDVEFPFKLEAGLGLELALKGSFVNEFDYIKENGILYNGTEYITSSANLSDYEIANREHTLGEILAEPWPAVKAALEDFFVSIGDAIVDGVTNAYTTVTGTVSGWFADISTAVSDIMPFRSYAILSLTEVDEPDGNAAVAVTIGDPYTVAVYTDATKQTLVSDEDLAKHPLTITMAYTGEMLTAAGAPADADINIYRFDFERNMYVCVANCVQDKESMTVTASIARHGEYILATDNASPLISDFEVSDGTATPTITALVSDLSGIGEFAFWLDEGTVLVDSVRFADCYDPVTGLFTYKVTQPLTAGEHTAWFRATDTIGNANAEPFSFTFTVDASVPVITDVTVPEDTVTSAEGFIIAANVTDDGQLSQVMAKVTAGETVTTRSMTQADGVWCVTVDGITGNVQATVEVIAVDMAGNRSQSDTFVVAIDIPEPPAGLQITAQRVGDTAEIAIGNHQRAMGGWVVAAVYDAEGRMLDMNGEYVGMKSGEVKNLSLVLDCEPERIAHGKVFFLDVSEGHEAMIPVCDFE